MYIGKLSVDVSNQSYQLVFKQCFVVTYEFHRTFEEGCIPRNLLSKHIQLAWGFFEVLHQTMKFL